MEKPIILLAGGADKGADFVVVNPPSAIAAKRSMACMLSPDKMVLPWRSRDKKQLAEEMITVIETCAFGRTDDESVD